jgi:hypothetical protein
VASHWSTPPGRSSGGPEFPVSTACLPYYRAGLSGESFVGWKISRASMSIQPKFVMAGLDLHKAGHDGNQLARPSIAQPAAVSRTTLPPERK